MSLDTNEIALKLIKKMTFFCYFVIRHSELKVRVLQKTMLKQVFFVVGEEGVRALIITSNYLQE